MVRQTTPDQKSDQWLLEYSCLRSAEQGEAIAAFDVSKPDDSADKRYGNCLSQSRQYSDLLSDSSGERSPRSQEGLRDYQNVTHGELLQWLWLDFSAPVKSPVSRLVRKNIRQFSSQDLVSMDQEEESEREEAVGLSRMASLVLAEGSLMSGVFTLVSSAMGAGCLSLPFMIKRAGLIPGLLMLCLGAILAHLSLMVLMSCAKYTSSSSMAKLVELASGIKMGPAVDIVIAVYGISAVLCYLIFIGDFFTGIVGSPMLGLPMSRESLIIGVSVCVVWPLSLPRDLSALRHVCVLSVLAICVTAVAVAWKVPDYIEAHAAVADSEEWQIKMWSSDPVALLQSFSIAIFAFAAHTNAVPVANALRQADGASIWRVSLYSVCIELIFYVLMGLGGYLSFRGFTKQDFILNYRNDDLAMFVVRCIYGIVVCLGAPINLSPAASSILGLFSNERHASVQQHSIVATTIVVGCVIVAVYNEQVADVIGLIGASFGSVLCFGGPAMVYKNVLFDLHPKGLAKFIFCSLVGAASVGFAAFVVQVSSFMSAAS